MASVTVSASILGIITSRAEAARRARAAGQAVVTFDPHPWVEPFVQLWHLAAHTAAHPSRSLPRTAWPSTAFASERQYVQRLSWSRLARLKHNVSTGSQRRLLHQIRGVRRSGWARSLNARRCLHCVPTGAAGGLTFLHRVALPRTHSLFGRICSSWRHLGMWQSGPTADSTAFRRTIFSLRLPSTPVGTTAIIASRAEPAASTAVHDVMEEIRVRHVLARLQTIWNWQHGIADVAHHGLSRCPVLHFKAGSVPRSRQQLAASKPTYPLRATSATS